MIKNTTKLALAVTATLLLAACESTRTADWYIHNTADQANKLAECARRPELSETPNCISANEAEILIKQGTEAIKEYRANNV